MKLFLPPLLLAGGLLLVALPNASARPPGPPGNYTDLPLNPTTPPTGPLGYDMLLCENVPGLTHVGPINSSGVMVPPFTDINATSVAVKLDIGAYGQVPPAGNAPITGAYTAPFNWSVTGPTGTYAAGTIGSGKHSENTKADIDGNYTSLAGPIYYQYEFDVTWYDTNNQIHHNTVYTQVGYYNA